MHLKIWYFVYLRTILRYLSVSFFPNTSSLLDSFIHGLGKCKLHWELVLLYWNEIDEENREFFFPKSKICSVCLVIRKFWYLKLFICNNQRFCLFWYLYAYFWITEMVPKEREGRIPFCDLNLWANLLSKNFCTLSFAFFFAWFLKVEVHFLVITCFVISFNSDVLFLFSLN